MKILAGAGKVQQQSQIGEFLQSKFYIPTIVIQVYGDIFV